MFCFPYAGGGASAYRGWGGTLSEVEVCPVQLPGRESRLRDAPFEQPEPLVLALADALQPYMQDLPFVFFGHSMGAMLGFELSRELRRRGQPLPLHLFVSGRRAPQVPDDDEPIHALPEAEFIAKLRELNGTPEEVLQHKELMKLLIPVLRADFSVNETYAYREEEPLDVGISAFGGIGDQEVSRDQVAAWKEQTRGRFRLRMLPGDHFFIHGNKAMVLEAVARDLSEVFSQAPQRA